MADVKEMLVRMRREFQMWHTFAQGDAVDLLSAVENVLAQCDAVDAKTGSYRSILHTTTIRAAITDALGATDE